MKHEKVSAVVKGVRDFRDGADGSKTVDVPYNYEYDVLETEDELRAVSNIKEWMTLKNQRIKSTANSSARQTATGAYAPADNPLVARESIIADMVNKLGIPRDVAEQQVDAMLEASK